MQIQFQYNIYEDRLRLVLSEEDHNQAWWITRRAAKMLAESFTARLSTAVGSGIVGAAREWFFALRREEVLKSIPITKEPSLSIDHSHLLTSIRYGSYDGSLHVLVLVGADGEEQSVTFDDNSLIAIIELFRSQLALTDWGLVLHWPINNQESDNPFTKMQ
jgi:hypothetical protein